MNHVSTDGGYGQRSSSDALAPYLGVVLVVSLHHRVRVEVVVAGDGDARAASPLDVLPPPAEVVEVVGKAQDQANPVPRGLRYHEVEALQG